MASIATANTCPTAPAFREYAIDDVLPRSLAVVVVVVVVVEVVAVVVVEEDIVAVCTTACAVGVGMSVTKTVYRSLPANSATLAEMTPVSFSTDRGDNDVLMLVATSSAWA